jgi:glucosamine--fructose-6-phosphate aminotransferase (isomerizing)
MEYRGYDSAGVCTVHDGQLVRRRAEGKLNNLVVELARNPAPGTSASPTRWATHGAPTTSNAHPTPRGSGAGPQRHHREFPPAARGTDRARAPFESETDTEVVAHLVSEQVEAGASPQDAVRAVLPQLRGAFALAIAFRQHPEMLIGARLGSPLVVGYGDGETYLGSDALALAPLTQRVLSRRRRLGRHHARWCAGVRRRQQPGSAIVASGRRRRDREGQLPPLHAEGDLRAADRRRPDAAQPAPRGPDRRAAADRFRPVEDQPRHHRRLRHQLLRRHGREILVRTLCAPAGRHRCRSEFRYRDPVLEPGGLALFISQSGETADTLAALRHCKAAGQTIAVVVNVPTSSMAREADLLLPTHAGPEIGVASTKAFSCQLAVLAALAAHLAASAG